MDPGSPELLSPQDPPELVLDKPEPVHSSPPWKLATVDEARTVLSRVQDRLRAGGKELATLRLPDGSTYDFDVITGPEFAPVGEEGCDCIVCQKNRHRTTAFYVVDTNQVRHGPIGSGCLLTHVLGEEEGKRVGTQLREKAEQGIALFVADERRRKHASRQRALRAAAGSGREYTEGLNLRWAILATASQDRRMPQHLHRSVERVLKGDREVYTEEELAELARVAEENAALLRVPEPRQPVLVWGAQEAAKAKKLKSIDKPVLQKEWEAYLLNYRLRTVDSDWSSVAPLIEPQEEVFIKEIQRKLTHRRYLNSREMEAVWRATGRLDRGERPDPAVAERWDGHRGSLWEGAYRNHALLRAPVRRSRLRVVRLVNAAPISTRPRSYPLPSPGSPTGKARLFLEELEAKLAESGLEHVLPILAARPEGAAYWLDRFMPTEVHAHFERVKGGRRGATDEDVNQLLKLLVIHHL